MAAAMVGAGTAGAGRLPAQQRLLTERTLGAGPTIETVRFGGTGIAQGEAIGADSSTLVRRVTQLSFPVSAAASLGGGWRLDVTSLVATGAVTLADAAGRERTATLGGISDVRARATGRLLSDAVLLTVGVNVPTGRTALDASEFSALRVLAAPALGMGTSPVGAGPSGTLGVVYARQARQWTMAFGTSFEHRGRFQPVQALVAGAPSIDFQPGAILRGSLSADRLLGPHRLHLSTSADVFTDDRLRDANAPGAGAPDLSRVRLGPVLSIDGQVEWATPRLRELVTYAAWRFRSPYALDGRTVTGSDGQYLEGGARGTVALRGGTSLVFGADGRWHSGLDVDRGLPAAGVTSAIGLIGLKWRRGPVALQPFTRAQVGRMRLRGRQVANGTQDFAGFTAGVIAVTRF
jgi:hypothetical protein